MIRIYFLTSLAMIMLTLVSFTQPTVNQQRMEKRIAELSQFGKDANGRAIG